jgi:hypothetical protein
VESAGSTRVAKVRPTSNPISFLFSSAPYLYI